VFGEKKDENAQGRDVNRMLKGLMSLSKSLENGDPTSILLPSLAFLFLSIFFPLYSHHLLAFLAIPHYLFGGYLLTSVGCRLPSVAVVPFCRIFRFKVLAISLAFLSHAFLLE
jgi:hypothetical protein